MEEINLKILEKLDTLVKLTTLNIVKDKNLKGQVKLLSTIGLRPKEIADLLGKDSNTVRTTLFQIRKGKSKNKTKKSTIRGVKT